MRRNRNQKAQTVILKNQTIKIKKDLIEVTPPKKSKEKIKKVVLIFSFNLVDELKLNRSVDHKDLPDDKTKKDVKKEEPKKEEPKKDDKKEVKKDDKKDSTKKDGKVEPKKEEPKKEEPKKEEPKKEEPKKDTKKEDSKAKKK